MSGRKRIDILSPALLAGLFATAVRPDGLGFLIGFAGAAVALVTLVAVSRRLAPAAPAAPLDPLEAELAKIRPAEAVSHSKQSVEKCAHRSQDSSEPPLQKKGKP